MKYGYRKWGKNKGLFELKNFKPAPYTRNAKTKPKYVINKKTIRACNRNTPACVHTRQKMNKTKRLRTPGCCRQHLNDILLFVTDVLKKNQIPYFMYWGTLLGSIRHGGSIPWDTDNDLYILDRDVPRLKKLFKIFNKKYFVSIVDKHFFRVNFSKKNRVHLDIYIAEQIK